jgi:tRNA-dihydrouridine synthase 4
MNAPVDIMAMFEQHDFLHVAAPMVRYSRLPFRLLVREFGTDIVYTPMILATSFIESESARDADFVTGAGDGPLVVQFAAPDPTTFARACLFVAPHCSAVSLNCGCPQRWVMREGLGSALMLQESKVVGCVEEAKKMCPTLPIEVKIRLHNDVRRTVSMVQQLHAAGADWITLHGRLVKQPSTSPPLIDQMTEVAAECNRLHIPIVFNGDVLSWDDVERVRDMKIFAGCMAARGLLANPALFSGPPAPSNSLNIVTRRFVDICTDIGLPFYLFHHHLEMMLYQACDSHERRQFANLRSVAGVDWWLRDRKW